MHRFNIFNSKMPSEAANDAKSRRKPSLVAKKAVLTYASTGKKVLHGVDFQIGPGEVVGLVGRNESGKTSLARVLTSQHPIDEGDVEYKSYSINEPPTPNWVWALNVAVVAGFIAIGREIWRGLNWTELRSRLFQNSRKRAGNRRHVGIIFALSLSRSVEKTIGWWVVGIFLIMMAVCLVEAWRRYANHRRRCEDIRKKVLHITSEDSPGMNLYHDQWTIRDAMCKEMLDTNRGKSANQNHTEKATNRAKALLKACNLQLYDRKGNPYGNADEYIDQDIPLIRCSGGQRHLIYVMSMLARDPEVVFADEILIGLDLPTQARVIGVLQYMATIRKMALVYITTDITPLELLCKRILFMEGGKVIANGKASNILFNSKVKTIREYVEIARGNRIRGRHFSSLQEEAARAIPEVRKFMKQAFS